MVYLFSTFLLIGFGYYCFSYYKLEKLGSKKPPRTEKERKHLEVMERVKPQEEFVRETVELYLENHECPCDWYQFEYWCGKEQGPGWQDGIQNDLVTEALKLPCFKDKQEAEVSYGYEEKVVCSSCGAKWKYYSEEWRMLAYHESLTRIDQEDSHNKIQGNMVGENIVQSVGFGPSENSKSLSLQEWREFMLNKSPNKSKHAEL